MNKKKTTKSKKTAKKSAKKSHAKAKRETNPADVRKEVSKLVEADAKEMAQAVIEEGKKGQLAPVKFLFEMANIYPPAQDGTQATTEEDCLAKILLDRLTPPAKPEEKDEEGAQGSGVGKDEGAGPSEAEGENSGGQEGDKKPEREAETMREVLV
ncbi:MAG TPA: hypothetical protein VEH47_08590 [Candidatus Acidoferrales bacterium]|nr:hypothetical protein [Candidatus Acidoferrales bacterium]